MRRVIAFCSIWTLCAPMLFAEEKGGSDARICLEAFPAATVRILNDIAAHVSSFLSGARMLTSVEKEAFAAVARSARECDDLKEDQVEGFDRLMQVMEFCATLGPNGKDLTLLAQVQDIRRVALEESDLTPPEIMSLNKMTTETGKPLSSKNVEIVKKYIESAKKQNGLVGFMIPEKEALIEVVSANLNTGFSVEDLKILREEELKADGFFSTEIKKLYPLSQKRNPLDKLSSSEEAVLKKWIQLEASPIGKRLVSFEEKAGLYALVQAQPDPPFPQRELKENQKDFEEALKRVPPHAVLPEDLEMLQFMADHVADALSEEHRLTSVQAESRQEFITALLQFGDVPGLSPLQVGRILQLIEKRKESTEFEGILKKIRFVELIKAGFTLEDIVNLQKLRERSLHLEAVPLTKEERALLKYYIQMARKPGGLNGFSSEERALIFTIVETHVKKGFSTSDVTVLREVEQEVNGFSVKEIEQIKEIARSGKSIKDLSPSDQTLLKKFILVEKQIGGGNLLDAKESNSLHEILVKQIGNKDSVTSVNQSDDTSSSELQEDGARPTVQIIPPEKKAPEVPKKSSRQKKNTQD